MTSCRSPRLAARIFSSSRLSSSAADARDASRSSSVIVVVVFSVVVVVDVGAGGGGGAGGRGRVVVVVHLRDEDAGRGSVVIDRDGDQDALVVVVVVRDVLGPTSATPSPSSSSSSSSVVPPGSARDPLSVFSLSLSLFAHLPRQLLVRSHLLELPLGHPVRQHPRLLRSLLAHEPVRIPLRLYPRSLFLLSLAPGVATMSSNAALCRSRSLRSSSNILARSAFSSSTPPRSHAAARRLSFGNTGESSR